MTDEESVRAQLVALLRYANKTAIAAQLGVSPQAVINWSEGKFPSQKRLDAVRRLYGLIETHESAPPGGPDEALTRIRLLVEAIAAATPGVDMDEVERAFRIATDSVRRSQRRDGAHQPGSPLPQGGQ